MMTTENDTPNDSNQTKTLLVSENIPPNQELIDDCFYVSEQRWKTWNSYDKEGKSLITSLTKEECINATRFYLKSLQDGTWNQTEKTYDSTVGGKL